MFIILLIVIAGFFLYLYLNEGFIYIASKHFEKEISFKNKNKSSEKNNNLCPNCKNLLEPGQKICTKCINKEIENYSSNNPFGQNIKRKF